MPGFNIVKSLNITLLVVPSFSIGVDMGYDTSASLDCCKYRFFFSITYIYKFLAQEY